MAHGHACHTYVDDNLEKPGTLFWIELDHSEGEMRVGLGRVTADADAPHELEEPDARWVTWCERKANRRHAWGNVVAFRPAMVFEGRRKVVQTTQESTFSFLPVVVETCGGSTVEEPKISKRCMEVLRAYLKKHRPDLLAENHPGTDDSVSSEGADDSDGDDSPISAAASDTDKEESGSGSDSDILHAMAAEQVRIKQHQAAKCAAYAATRAKEKAAREAKKAERRSAGQRPPPGAGGGGAASSSNSGGGVRSTMQRALARGDRRQTGEKRRRRP